MPYQAIAVVLVAIGIGILSLSLAPAMKLHSQNNNKGWHLLFGLICLFLLAYIAVLYQMVIAEHFAAIGAGFGMILWSGSVFVYLSITMFLKSLQKLKQVANEYERALTHDSLTNLPNRHSMIEELDECLQQGAPIALFIVDVVQFKRINNTLGSHYGDRLLIYIAQLMSDRFGRYCSVHRIGGNEFSLILKGSELEQLNWIASELTKLNDTLVSFDDYQTHLSLAAGYCLLPEQANSSAQVIERTNIALQEAKMGEIGVVQYSEAIDIKSNQPPNLLNQFIAAIERDQLEVHYQPIVDASSKQTVGVEALTRWPSVDGSYISPALFIPVAENANKISLLTVWLIDKVAADVALLTENTNITDIHINLSAKDLLNRKVLSCLEWHAINTPKFAKCICLEVTESAAFEQSEVTNEVIKSLRELGFSFSLDDFGTGYSSLSLLRELPVQQVKLDRSFVSNISNSFYDYNIVKTMIELGHVLGYTVVAEGVEHPEVARELQSLGCDYLQGFLFSKAVTIEQLSANYQQVG